VRAPATFPDEPEPDPELIVINRISLISITTTGNPAFEVIEVRP
jgi:hypothetical protein